MTVAAQDTLERIRQWAREVYDHPDDYASPYVYAARDVWELMGDDLPTPQGGEGAMKQDAAAALRAIGGEAIVAWLETQDGYGFVVEALRNVAGHTGTVAVDRVDLLNVLTDNDQEAWERLAKQLGV